MYNNPSSGSLPSGQQRSAQIADYVAKQKQQKMAAEQIRQQRTAGTTSQIPSVNTNTRTGSLKQTISVARQGQGQGQGYDMYGNAILVEEQPIRTPAQPTYSSNYSQDTSSGRNPYGPGEMDNYVPQQIHPNTSNRSPAHPRSAGPSSHHQSPNHTHTQPQTVSMAQYQELVTRINTLEELCTVLKQQNRVFHNFMKQQQTRTKEPIQQQQQSEQQQPPSWLQEEEESSSSSRRPTSGRRAVPQYGMDEKSQYNAAQQAKTAKQKEIERINNRMKPKTEDEYGYEGQGEGQGYGGQQQSYGQKQSGYGQPTIQQRPTQGYGQQQQQQQQQQPYQPQQYQQSQPQPQQRSRLGYASQADLHSQATPTSRQPNGRAPSRGHDDGGYRPATQQTFMKTDDDNPPLDPYASVPLELFPCPSCGRKFSRDALNRHVAKRACEKANRERKIFDMSKQRLDAEMKQELTKVLQQQSQQSGKKTNKTTQKNGYGEDRPLGGEAAEKKPKWKIERDRLREALRAGRSIAKAIKDGVPLSSIPIVQSTQQDDRVECPHCSRKFAEQTAERHIPHCKNTINKPKGVGAGVASRPSQGTLKRR